MFGRVNSRRFERSRRSAKDGDAAADALDDGEVVSGEQLIELALPVMQRPDQAEGCRRQT
jgi:hypothetical protein